MVDFSPIKIHKIVFESKNTTKKPEIYRKIRQDLSIDPIELDNITVVDHSNKKKEMPKCTSYNGGIETSASDKKTITNPFGSYTEEYTPTNFEDKLLIAKKTGKSFYGKSCLKFKNDIFDNKSYNEMNEDVVAIKKVVGNDSENSYKNKLRKISKIVDFSQLTKTRTKIVPGNKTKTTGFGHMNNTSFSGGLNVGGGGKEILMANNGTVR